MLGGPDDPDDPARRPLRLRALRVAVAAAGSELLVPAARAPLLRLLGAKLGAGTVVEANVRVTLPSRLVTGRGVYVNFDCVLDSNGGIEIGDEVAFGPAVRLLTTTHDIGGRERRAGERRYRPIVVGRGSWIGGGATVLPGAVVGPGCVVGGGAVVTGELEPNGLYVGSPARRIRDLP